jgi:anti-anti-sigma factor
MALRLAVPNDRITGEKGRGRRIHTGIEPVPKLLELRTEDDSGIARLVASGELDLATSEQLEDELKRHEQGGADTIMLDLRELTFMDSTGLRTVIAADARARERGGRLVIVRPPEEVDRVFRLTRMHEHLEMVDEPPSGSGRA